MASRVAKHVDEDLRGAVDHLGVTDEVRRGVDDTAQRDDLLHRVERAEGGPDRGQRADRGESRRLTPGRDIEVAPELAQDQGLLAASEQYLRFALDHPQFFRMLAFPGKPGPYPAAADTAALLSRRVDEQNARMVDAIERGIADGTVRQLDPRKTATILWASWNGIMSLAWRHDDLRQDPEALGELIEKAADLVSYGLRLR